MNEAPSPPELNGLVELANRDGVDIRPTLLRVMTDLYVQKPAHTEQEAKQYTELALRLIELVDIETRAVIAEKIAGCPTAPAAVRHRLLREVITVKAPGSAVNPGSAAADELSELFFACSAEERRLIVLNLPYGPMKPATPIEPATASESIHRLEAAALGHNGEVFARELERTLGISRAHARRLYEDTSGEPIVVLAVALGMPTAVLQRVLLCLNPSVSQSVQRVYELALLHKEMEIDGAMRLLAIWQASHPAEKKSPAPASTGHQPQYSQDEKSTRGTPDVRTTRPRIRWDELVQARKAEGA